MKSLFILLKIPSPFLVTENDLGILCVYFVFISSETTQIIHRNYTETPYKQNILQISFK